VVEAIKSKGRVAAIVIGNASVASFDEGVLTLRFPRQGDVKGFIGSKYEDLLKQALNAMFGVNVVVRAVTGGGDAPSGGRRPGPGPAAPPAPAPFGQPSASPYGQPPAPGQPPGPPLAAPDYPQQAAAPAPPGAGPPPEQSYAAGPGAAVAGQAPGATAGGGEGTGRSLRGAVVPGGDLPPLPSAPPPDDEDFDPDDEGMSVPVSNELTGMALVQRELGGQIIGEFDD
jgi:DNA polymerase-3 subunit gamma/tau